MSTVLSADWLPSVFPSRPSEIFPNVWVGDSTDARAAWYAEGWTVIDVREGKDPNNDPAHVVRIPLLRADTDWNAGRKALTEIADAIDRALAKGHSVLVHCWAGIERSPLSVAAWLVMRQGYTIDEAYKLLNARRGVADRRGWLTKKARRELGVTGVEQGSMQALLARLQKSQKARAVRD